MEMGKNRISSSHNRDPSLLSISTIHDTWIYWAGPHGDTQGTKEDQGRDGGTTYIVLVKHRHCVMQNVVQ